MAEFAKCLQSQNIWFQAAQYRAAEVKLAQYNLGIVAGGDNQPEEEPKAKQAISTPASDMIKEIKKDLNAVSTEGVVDITEMLKRVDLLEKENETIKGQLESALAKLDALEAKIAAVPAAEPAAAPVAASKPAAEEEEEEDDDDDCDLFGSDDDDEVDDAAEALKAKRVAEYNARKAAKEETKGKVIAKSSITFDVKPWDDETDLDEVDKMIREIAMDGLLWGVSKKKPLAYGIFKLTILCVVEDDKVSSDDLVEQIEAFEDHVQSVDIAAFNKI